jgi:heme/copper-type cytochrome/quinol oxidase subunit 2
MEMIDLGSPWVFAAMYFMCMLVSAFLFYAIFYCSKSYDKRFYKEDHATIIRLTFIWPLVFIITTFFVVVRVFLFIPKYNAEEYKPKMKGRGNANR